LLFSFGGNLECGKEKIENKRRRSITNWRGGQKERKLLISQSNNNSSSRSMKQSSIKKKNG